MSSHPDPGNPPITNVPTPQAAAMVLAQALVDLENAQNVTPPPSPPPLPHTGDAESASHRLPSFPMHIAQQIQTRADFVRELDRLNLFTITSSAQMRASSVPMHRAFREICSLPGFREHLEKTNERIAAIESLGRTRELVAKDLVLGGKYDIEREGKGGKMVVSLRQPPEEGEGE